MKKITLLIFFILTVTSGFSQKYKLGLEVGSNYPILWTKSDKTLNGNFLETSGRPGFNMGLELKYSIFDQSEIAFLTQYQGMLIKNEPLLAADNAGNIMGYLESYDINSYANVGVHYCYTYNKKHSIFAGAKLFFLLMSKTFFLNADDFRVAGKKMPTTISNRYYKRVYLSVPLGFNFTINKFYIRAQYNFAITPAIKIDNSFKRFDNTIELNIGLNILSK
ncbi:MAG: hypothetical protein B6I19_08080 [Bacteroidetes bacterium 4572_114]|nr:MAG: hypothetical protein B6I19_08080 [Bacteroidetes bacterium 4572_114]